MAKVSYLSNTSALLDLSHLLLIPLSHLAKPQLYAMLAQQPGRGYRGITYNTNPGSDEQLGPSDPAAQIPSTVLCEGGCKDARCSLSMKGEPQCPVLLMDPIYYLRGCRPHSPHCLQKYLMIVDMIFTLTNHRV